MVVRPLQKLLKPALFPEIARQTARGDRKLRRKLVLRHSALAMGFALLLFLGLAVFGRSVLSVAMGEAYAAAYGVMLMIALAGVVRAAILPVEPLLYATGHVRIVLSAQVSALIVFVPALYGGVLWLNVLGAGLAAVVHAVALSAFFLLFGRRVILGHLAIIAPEAKAAQ